MYLNTDLAIPCQRSRFLRFLQSHGYLYNLYKIQGSLGAMRDFDRCIIPVGEFEVKSSTRKKEILYRKLLGSPFWGTNDCSHICLFKNLTLDNFLLFFWTDYCGVYLKLGTLIPESCRPLQTFGTG